MFPRLISPTAGMNLGVSCPYFQLVGGCLECGRWWQLEKRARALLLGVMKEIFGKEEFVMDGGEECIVGQTVRMQANRYFPRL
jgi:hypothetical protein